MTQRSPRFKQIASTGVLLLAALIWGMCFVAQRSGMEHIGPFIFNGIRELMGAGALLLVLLAFWLFRRIRTKDSPEQDVKLPGEDGTEAGVIVEPGFKRETEERIPGEHKRRYRGIATVFIGGVLCGLALYFASNLQQIGMVYVSASKAAFITTQYIVLVPIMGLFLHQKTHWNTWVSVAVAAVGLYLLCMGESYVLEFGDAILLVSAIFWAIHILAVGHFAPRFSVLQLFGMCAVQFATAGLLSLATAPFADHYFVAAPVTMEAIVYVMPELLYAGILSTAGGFTLAAIGQRYAKPAPAAIMMSLESVFGLLGGVVLLGEVISTQEGIGCILLLAAVILTQLSFKRKQPQAAES